MSRAALLTLAGFLVLSLTSVIPNASSCGEETQAMTDSQKETNGAGNTIRAYTDKAHGFHISVPQGWSATPTSYAVQHYRDVFLCVNSGGNKALRVINQRKGSTESYSPETVAEQLTPGTVYLDFAIFDGPGGGANFKGKPDTVGKDLSPLLKDFKPIKIADGKLSMVKLSFIKREHRWHLYAFFREPVKPELRKQAETLLRSFRFIDEPVAPDKRDDIPPGPVKPTSKDDPNTSQNAAVLAIRKLGGQVTFDPRRQVTAVKLVGPKFTDEHLVHLKGMTSLQTLNLTNSRVTDAGLRHLKGLTDLQSLHLYGTAVTDAGLKHLTGLTNLAMLNLDLTKVTDAGLVHLKKWKHLEILSIYLRTVTDAGLVHLKGMTSLRKLNLSATKVTDAGLVHLKELKNLNRLELTYTKVTNAGLVHVEGLTRLQTLSLAYTKVNDLGLEHLYALPKLETLYLIGSGVTADGAKALRRAVPKCNTDLAD